MTYTVKQFNALRGNGMPLERQKQAIKQLCGNRLVAIGINPENSRYITYLVRV